MPLFYFDVQDGDKIFPDEVGVDIANLEEARREAVRALTEMAVDTLPGDGPRRLMTIGVLDARRQPELQISISFEVKQLRAHGEKTKAEP